MSTYRLPYGTLISTINTVGFLVRNNLVFVRVYTIDIWNEQVFLLNHTVYNIRKFVFIFL